MDMSVQIRKKGNLTLPRGIRQKYYLHEGDVLSIVDLGDGSFLLTPRVSQINRLGEQVTEIL